MLHLCFVMYFVVFGLVIIVCLSAVGWLTGCALVVTSVFVVLQCRDLSMIESRVKFWHL